MGRRVARTPKSGTAWISAAAVFISVLPLAFASQPSGGTKLSRVYRADREQTISGVIESVGNPPRGPSLPGEHLILRTSSGRQDVHLAPPSPGGADANEFRAGERVEITGCMVSHEGQNVFLARQVKRGAFVIVLRNKNGYPITSRGNGGRALAARAQ